MTDDKRARWPEWLPLRHELRDRSPYGAPQVEARARLNTNENPHPLPPSVIEAITASISANLRDLNRYPDRDAWQLRTVLAGYINERITHAATDSPQVFKAENIWPANGSNEVLQSILLAFGESVAGFSPSYSMHPILSEAIGKSFKAVPLRGDFTPDLAILRGFLTAKKPTIFFLTTPNNPTGRAMESNEIREIAEMVAEYGGLLVIDEAYGEFSDCESSIALIHQIPSVIIVRTMSKAFAFAGARVGYAIARPEVIDALQLVRLPYHLSAITQAAAIAALGQSELLLAEVDRIKQERERVAQALRALRFDVIPSDANFILFGGFSAVMHDAPLDGPAIWRALLDHGVLIRDVGIDGWLRVTIGTSEENDLFLDSLRLIVGQ